MGHLTSEVGEIGWVVLKAVLLYLTAVFGFRLGERRTLAQLSPFDFVAAVAVGAIVGRVPNAHDASYLAGAATLLAVLAAHAVLTRLRLLPGAKRVLEHAPRLLVLRGQVLEDELRRCGLTPSDLHGVLRQHGVEELSSVRYAVFEQRGQISVVRQVGPESPDPELLRGIGAGRGTMRAATAPPF
jgi:uncharacterized membrane protein YcaP (DUF421 family)